MKLPIYYILCLQEANNSDMTRKDIIFETCKAKGMIGETRKEKGNCQEKSLC